MRMRYGWLTSSKPILTKYMSVSLCVRACLSALKRQMTSSDLAQHKNFIVQCLYTFSVAVVVVDKRRNKMIAFVVVLSLTLFIMPFGLLLSLFL